MVQLNKTVAVDYTPFATAFWQKVYKSFYCTSFCSLGALPFLDFVAPLVLPIHCGKRDKIILLV